MKTVYILRHAKASHKPEHVVDFERPLTKRGRRQCEALGTWMAEHGHLPDLIISSSAKRAKETALLCAKVSGYRGEIRFTESLYAANEEVFIDLMQVLPDSVRSVAFVGHNPEMSMLTETLSGEFCRLSTAALGRVDFDAARWVFCDEGQGLLAWVKRPED